MLIFDIETGPLPDEKLLEMIPEFDESDYQETEFTESLVKTGNLKDPLKIQEKIESARRLHIDAMAELKSKAERDRASHFESFKSQASLSAIYGQVVAVGMFAPLKDIFVMLDATQLDEELIVEQTLGKISDCIHSGRMVAGHNVFEFDLPFLIRRAWILGLTVPNNICLDLTSKWPKWHPNIIDTRKIWMMGGSGPGSKFDDLAAAFDTGGKPVGTNGSMFHKMLMDDISKAVEYLENDVRQPAEWLRRMGILEPF